MRERIEKRNTGAAQTNIPLNVTAKKNGAMLEARSNDASKSLFASWFGRGNWGKPKKKEKKGEGRVKYSEEN